MSSAAWRVVFTSTATMSGRGTMIWRTMVSPNSKIEWIIFLSVSSMLPSTRPPTALAVLALQCTPARQRPEAGCDCLVARHQVDVSGCAGGGYYHNDRGAIVAM